MNFSKMIQSYTNTNNICMEQKEVDDFWRDAFDD